MRTRETRQHRDRTSIVTPGLIGRLRDQRVVAVPFANYALAHGDELRGCYGPRRVERVFAHRAMLDAAPLPEPQATPVPPHRALQSHPPVAAQACSGLNQWL
jgi:hypothetical protein